MVSQIVKLTALVQAACLLLALQNAATPAMGFLGRGLPRESNTNSLVARNAAVDISNAIFEHADTLVKRDDEVSPQETEEEDYDELEIITVFLPEESEENPIDKRAGPTPCPAEHTRRRRRSLAAETARPYDKRDPSPEPREHHKPKTVTITKTIYETVYRRCTELVRRDPKKHHHKTPAREERAHHKTPVREERAHYKTPVKKVVHKPTPKRYVPPKPKYTPPKKKTTSTKRHTTSTKKHTTSTKKPAYTPPPPPPPAPKPKTTSTTPKAVPTTSSKVVVAPVVTPKPSSSSPTTTSHSTTSSSSTSSSSTVTPPAKKVYSLMADYEGANFYNNMYFFTFSDPTNGLVDYVGQQEASSLGLVKTTNGGQVYMGYATTRIYPPSSTVSSTSTNAPHRRAASTSTSSSTSASSSSTGSSQSSSSSSSTSGTQSGSASVTTPSSTSSSSSTTSAGGFSAQEVGSSSPTTTTTSKTSSTISSTSTAATSTGPAPIPYMKAVRVSSLDTFTTGVFVLDASHMPVGCGTWPAWWTVPTNPAGGWPNGGEIDIVEGISFTSQNTYSVHTIPGCSVNATANQQKGTYALQNQTLATNCASAQTNNQGCGVQSSYRDDFGVGYNKNGGGIHAMVWDADEGIRSWFWYRNKAPADIAAGSPDPTGWGEPQASWPAQNCDPKKFFFNHVSVFTNTICGDWAGDNYLWNNALNGQTTSCAQRTGYPSCQAYVQSKDVDFSHAYWLINSVKIYQTTRMT